MKKLLFLIPLIFLTLLTLAHPFTDVNSTSWYSDSISYAYETGLMNGTSDTEFSPDGTTTRGMIVTILYRLAGSPNVAGDNGFSDVPKTEYYNTPVTWAVQNNIVSGYGDGVFAPGDNITREQLAAIIYRYLDCIDFDVSKTADLSVFEDCTSVSDYAKTALSWAVEAGLVKGMTENTLIPQGNATRAQAAAIFMRLDMMIKQLEKKDEPVNDNKNDSYSGGTGGRPSRPQNKPENVPDDNGDNTSDVGVWDKLN